MRSRRHFANPASVHHFLLSAPHTPASLTPQILVSMGYSACRPGNRLRPADVSLPQAYLSLCMHTTACQHFLKYPLDFLFVCKESFNRLLRTKARGKDVRPTTRFPALCPAAKLFPLIPRSPPPSLCSWASPRHPSSTLPPNPDHAHPKPSTTTSGGSLPENYSSF